MLWPILSCSATMSRRSTATAQLPPWNASRRCYFRFPAMPLCCERRGNGQGHGSAHIPGNRMARADGSESGAPEQKFWVVDPRGLDDLIVRTRRFEGGTARAESGPAAHVTVDSGGHAQMRMASTPSARIITTPSVGRGVGIWGYVTNF